MFQKIPRKFHDKTVQSNILWLNLNKISEISFLQSAHKQGNPSFHFHALGWKHRYPWTQTASVVPKYFPCLLQFCTGYRIWHVSRAWKRKMSEKCSFTQLKISRYNRHFFTIFRQILIKWPPTYLLQSDHKQKGHSQKWWSRVLHHNYLSVAVNFCQADQFTNSTLKPILAFMQGH